MPKMNTGSEVNLESHGVYRLIYRYQGGLWRPHTVRSSNTYLLTKPEECYCILPSSETACAVHVTGPRIRVADTVSTIAFYVCENK